MNAINKPAGRFHDFFQSGRVFSISPRIILGLILAIAVLPRLYISFFSALPHMHRDSFEYFNQADVLLKGGYIDYFPNGYPFIIALFKTVTGDHTVTAILVMNIILSVFTIYFIYVIAKKIFKQESIALIAAFIVAFFPSQINLARWLTTEIPVTFLLTGAYFFYLRKQNWLSGLFFGIAIIIRTEIMFIFGLLLLFELIFRKTINWKAVLAAMIPVLMIAFYCHSKTGKYSISGHGKANIMLSVTASGSYIDWTYMDKHPEVTTTGEAVQLYIKHAKENPGQYLKERAANLWELWSFFPSSDGGERGLISRIVIGLGNIFLLSFGLYGWWKNRKNFEAFILILPFLVITPLHVVLLALSRYTFPIEPFLIVLCSWTLYKILGPRESKPVAENN